MVACGVFAYPSRFAPRVVREVEKAHDVNPSRLRTRRVVAPRTLRKEEYRCIPLLSQRKGKSFPSLFITAIKAHDGVDVSRLVSWGADEQDQRRRHKH